MVPVRTPAPVLIGGGAHAVDIAATIPIAGQVAHHDDYTGSGPIVIGVNDPRRRAAISQTLDVLDRAWVHPSVVVGPRCSWGPGTHINAGVTLTRTRIGWHTTIAPGVTICGDVTIGDRVLIGAGATICDRVTIEDGVTVGAGAVVLPLTRLFRDRTYVGVPAR